MPSNELKDLLAYLDIANCNVVWSEREVSWFRSMAGTRTIVDVQNAYFRSTGQTAKVRDANSIVDELCEVFKMDGEFNCVKPLEINEALEFVALARVGELDVDHVTKLTFLIDFRYGNCRKIDEAIRDYHESLFRLHKK